MWRSFYIISNRAIPKIIQLEISFWGWYTHIPQLYIYIHMYVYRGTFADPHKATSKGRWDWSENSAGTPNQRAFKLSVGGQQQLNSSQKYIYIYIHIYMCV